MRRHYLVTYDIADDKRRNTVFQTLHGFGNHAQYSVFFCELSARELAQLRTRLRDTVHHRDDQVLIIDLGQASRPLESGLEVIGKGYEPPVRTVVI
jgi:CRISPR-associated protein Cas2